MKKKIRYIEEIYTDEYRTLYQAIQIDVDCDKKSNGLHSKSIRARINPNLTILLKRRYLTDTYKLVKEEIIGDDKMKRKIKSISIDEKIYNEFMLYASCLGRSVSSLIEQFMRETLKEMKKEK